jgi:hypothetical protein
MKVQSGGMNFIICRFKLESAQVIKLLHKAIEKIDRHGECRLYVRFGFKVEFRVCDGRCFCRENDIVLTVFASIPYCQG